MKIPIFSFQFSDDGAPETSQLTMSIGSATLWNFLGKGLLEVGNFSTYFIASALVKSMQCWSSFGDNILMRCSYLSPVFSQFVGRSAQVSFSQVLT
jgi:hypothetical protein